MVKRPPPKNHRVPVTKPVPVRKGATFECEHCGAVRSKSYKAEHIRRCLKIKRFFCNVDGCRFVEEGFVTAIELQRHIEHAHSEERNYLCQYDGCNECFKSQSNLRGHVVRVHLNRRDYICLCGAKFNTAGDLNRHAAIHDPSMWLTCPFELRTFRQYRNFYRHFKVHSHGDQERHRQLKAEFDSEQMIEPDALTALLFDTAVADDDALVFPARIVVRKRRVRGKHECEYESCKRAYSTTQDLRRHIVAQHTEIDRYTCPFELHNPTLTHSFKKHLRSHASKDPDKWNDLCAQFDSMTLISHQDVTAQIADVDVEDEESEIFGASRIRILKPRYDYKLAKERRKIVI